MQTRNIIKITLNKDTIGLEANWMEIIGKILSNIIKNLQLQGSTSGQEMNKYTF